MIWSAAAVGAAFLLSAGTPVVLRRLGRVHRTGPRTMLVSWTLATAVWLLTCTALVTTLVAQIMGPGVKAFVAACVGLLQAVHANGAEAGVTATAVLATTASARLLWTAFRSGRASAAWRREHRFGLATAARRRVLHHHRVWLLDSAEPGAYCVPDRHAEIVVTRGALDNLTAQEMRAVLAHEEAHLRGRHHLLVAWVRLLNTSFPGIPLLRAAAEEVPVLVEWVADDHAARVVGPRPLAHALGIMATSRIQGSAGALAVSGADPVWRVRRQLVPEPGLSWTRHLAVGTATLIAVVLPLAVAVAATVLNAALPYCECTASGTVLPLG